MKDKTILCQICNERRPPAVFRAIMCGPCAERLRAEMLTPKPQADVPRGFLRNDARMP